MLALKTLGVMLASAFVILALAWLVGDSGKQSATGGPVRNVNEEPPVQKQVVIKISDRYKSKFMDLYDEVKLTEAGVGEARVADIPEIIRRIKGKLSLLPKPNQSELEEIDALVRRAADGLVRYVDNANTYNELDKLVRQGGAAGNAAQGARQQAADFMRRSKTQCTESLAAIESNPLFNQLAE